jgi:hypothetical protein
VGIRRGVSERALEGLVGMAWRQEPRPEGVWCSPMLFCLGKAVPL